MTVRGDRVDEKRAAMTYGLFNIRDGLRRLQIRVGRHQSIVVDDRITDCIRFFNGPRQLLSDDQRAIVRHVNRMTLVL